MPQPRFQIRRHAVDLLSYTRPWVLRDRCRPHFLGQYPTHRLALLAVANIIRREHGEPERLLTTNQANRGSEG